MPLNNPPVLLSSKVITATRDLAAAGAPSDVSYTGVEFTPTSIIAFGGISNAVPVFMGVVDSAKTGKDNDTAFNGNSQPDANNFIRCNSASGAQQTAVVKSYDADGFTLTWTKSNSPTGTLTMFFLCLR